MGRGWETRNALVITQEHASEGRVQRSERNKSPLNAEITNNPLDEKEDLQELHPTHPGSSVREEALIGGQEEDERPLEEKLERFQEKVKKTDFKS